MTRAITLVSHTVRPDGWVAGWIVQIGWFAVMPAPPRFAPWAAIADPAYRSLDE